MKTYWPRSFELGAVHLQMRDAYVEERLAGWLARVSPRTYGSSYPYGFIDLRIDSSALRGGDLVLESVQALFPSGLLLDTRVARFAPPIRRDVSSALSMRSSSGVDVWLAVPKLTADGPNVSAKDGTNRSVRYIAEGDSTTPWIRPHAEILIDHEPHDRFETLSLGSLVYSGRQLAFDTAVVPTVFRIAAAPALQAALEGFIAVLEARWRELLEDRLDHPFSLAAASYAQLPSIELHALIQGTLPLLRELAARRSALPHELYDILLHLYGMLYPFGAKEPAPPPYDHEALGGVFAWFFERIEPIIKTVARDETPVLSFQSAGEGFYHLAFSGKALIDRRVLLVITGVDASFMRDRLAPLLKMAVPARLDAVMAASTRGVAVAEEFEPPAAVPRRPDVTCFRIHTGDPLWREILEQGHVRLFLPQAGPSIRMFLYFVERGF